MTLSSLPSLLMLDMASAPDNDIMLLNLKLIFESRSVMQSLMNLHMRTVLQELAIAEDCWPWPACVTCASMTAHPLDEGPQSHDSGLNQCVSALSCIFAHPEQPFKNATKPVIDWATWQNLRESACTKNSWPLSSMLMHPSQALSLAARLLRKPATRPPQTSQRPLWPTKPYFSSHSQQTTRAECCNRPLIILTVTRHSERPQCSALPDSSQLTQPPLGGR